MKPLSLQLSNNPQLRVLPGCPPTKNFKYDPSNIKQFLKPYQDALATKKSRTAEQERARLPQEQQMRAEKDKKEREEKEAKDRKAKGQQLMEGKSSSTSTPMILQILQGHVPPSSMALQKILDCKRDGSTTLDVRWPSLSPSSFPAESA